MTGVEEAAIPALVGAGATTYGGLTAAQLAALALSVGGTGASLAAQQQQAGERREIANRQLVRTKQAQEKTNAMINAEGKQYDPAARTEALAGEQAATLAQETQDLGSAPTIIEGAGDAGNVSSDFLTAKTDKALTEGNRLTAIARELSKTRAPGQLLNTEAMRRANLTGDLSSIWGSTRAAGNAAQLDAENVAEPWYGGLGKIASAAGGAYLASGAGAPRVDGAGGMALQEGAYPASITGKAGPLGFAPSLFATRGRSLFGG